MHSLLAAVLFSAVAALVAVSEPSETAAQDKKDDKKAQPKFDPPKATKPDEATLKTIKDKTEELRKAIAALNEKRIGDFVPAVARKGKIADNVLIEVEIYLKAAENIVRFEEWYAAASGKWALTTLDQGLARAKQAEGGKAVWRDAPGKWVLRAYRSYIDDSIQPYAVLLPPDYGKDPKKKWRLDIVLHGRDGALTEAKFIATHNGNAPKDLDYIQLEAYGRGNNAYRWAGEQDVRDVATMFRRDRDEARTVLRGFSMGGAGTWHIGLHYPHQYCVIGPGAGFTTTHSYVANLPKQLPDYQEKCLHIYDAVDYAENAFNVPVVAYSGEKDPQKKAADIIENALKGFKEPLKFTHLVAPGLEHQMPKEWQEKAETEYRKYTDKGRTNPERIHFVTYTTRYADFEWGYIGGLEEHHTRAVVDGSCTPGKLELKTVNVSSLILPVGDTPHPLPDSVTIDGQKVEFLKVAGRTASEHVLVKRAEKWAAVDDRVWAEESYKAPRKRPGRQGPIDDAFMNNFVVVGPTGDGWHTAPTKYATAEVGQFGKVWDKYFRGALPTMNAGDYKNPLTSHFVLFGDPQSNPLIAKVLPKLPITWTKEKLVVNGVEYDPKTHVPVLIYLNPLTDYSTYVVLNSGHTFKEADLKGTNALLYPRLGDWAVIKPTPTDTDPAAYEVVAAGLFDENWQFPKKK